ncbi:ABC transporter permease [Vallitalea sp.]|jgi:sodium transport system permease protein|uniref:ABC transporter permease n=1 Tax=Vallitalea sp. TaxID=1882829 RepID=UPI0025F45FC5|nr:ABC transporter permease [Vallitalea sp.]MCT4686982.1 ABC transporter permease [Vallitalea sp.]
MLRDILKKELKRVFTDRRLVFSAFILPALSIFIVYTIMGSMLTNMIDDIEEHTSTVYIQNAPEQFQKVVNEEELNMNITYIDMTEDTTSIKEQIKNGEVDMMVQFEDGFLDKVNNYKNLELPPEVKTFYNPSEEYSQESRKRFVDNTLNKYETQILTNRFGNINNVIAFDIDRNHDESIVVDEKKASGQGISMILPMLIAIILFSGAMGIGMDTIAGEKERGTMATLLLTPVKRETIALGKVIGLGIVAIVSAIISFTAIIASMPFSSKMLTGGADMNLGALQLSAFQLIQLLIIMITLVGIYVGLICLLSVRARTVKEAGTYVTPVFMIVMIAAFSTMFGGGATELYHYAIPVYGSVSALKAALSFELTMNQFLVTAISSFVVSLILVRLITLTFNDEKVMLNA